MSPSRGDSKAPRRPSGGVLERLRRRAALLAAMLVAAGLLVAVFVAPIERARVLTQLLSALAWPLGITFGLALFWPQVQIFVREIARRAESGEPVGVGPFNLPAIAQRIPTPAADADVSLANIALLHTSFVRPDKTAEYGDGATYFQFEAVVVAPPAVMERIESVVYHLEEAWPPGSRNPERRDPRDRFKLKELANGTSILRATVTFKGENRSLELNRFIDLRPDGPRL